METVHLSHRVEKQAEGRYYTLPFEVPAGVERLTVAYSYPKAGTPTAIIDLGLQNEQGQFVGWSGGARSSVTVGAHTATPGYLQAPVGPGRWGILVGAYKVPPEGLTVDYTLTFDPGGPRWLFGDLHAHTDASDGQYDVGRLAHMARAKGLDFLAPANHNNYTDNLHLPAVEGLTMLPAVEWTHYRGHMNLFGPAMPFEGSFVANSPEEMRALIAGARAKGALVSVNHPKDPTCPYLWADEDAFDTVEVWNGPMRPANMAAIRWWEGLLRAGRRLPLVGGSDFHRSKGPVRLGHPTTAVFAASPAAGDILAALRAGRSYVTSGPKGPRLAMDYAGKSFGDETPLVPGQALHFSVQNAAPGTRLLLVTDERPAPLVFSGPRGGTISGSHTPAGARFAYLMAARPLFGRWWVRAISNPIYFV